MYKTWFYNRSDARFYILVISSHGQMIAPVSDYQTQNSDSGISSGPQSQEVPRKSVEDHQSDGFVIQTLVSEVVEEASAVVSEHKLSKYRLIFALYVFVGGCGKKGRDKWIRQQQCVIGKRIFPSFGTWWCGRSLTISRENSIRRFCLLLCVICLLPVCEYTNVSTGTCFCRWRD